jgi:hypothetical protein
MTIHHATIKRAAALSIELVEGFDSEAGPFVTATKLNVSYVHPKAAQALDATALQTTFNAEYPNLQLLDEPDGWIVKSRNGEIVVTGPDDKVPALADVLEAAQDLDIDPEEGFDEAEDDDEKVPATVVLDHYKRLYKSLGRKADCGDFLALFLEGQCKVIMLGAKTKETFDPYLFQRLLTINEVRQEGKWAALFENGSKGWAGRYRMNGRQKLEMVVAKCGFVVGLDHTKHEVPANALAVLRAKHKVKATTPAIADGVVAVDEPDDVDLEESTPEHRFDGEADQAGTEG